jgi:hypothetical protein
VVINWLHYYSIYINTWKVIPDAVQKLSHGSVAELQALLGKIEVVPVNTMKAYGGVQVYPHSFLTLTLYGGMCWAADLPGRNSGTL